MLRYRADIDGLRAIAVVAVVLFHVGLGPFTGGYVGVDVFFVISGFLISKGLLQELDGGRLSLVGFYERRVRRIFPALFVMLSVTFLAFSLILSHLDLIRLAKGVVATLAFASNILFFREAGYFAPAAELQPLLHTWSLAVEEQFYIVFPLILAALARFRRATGPVLIGITLASFLLSLWLTTKAPAFNFYLPFTRAWELMLGALLAAGLLPTARLKPAAGVLAVLALVLLIAPCFLYTAQTPFPGLAAIPPTLGSVLIIGFAEHTMVGRLLANRVMVYIGRISYSLYLWHWPVIVFARYWELFEFGPWTPLICVATSFAFASLSYHFVETPFRRRGAIARNKLFMLAGVASVALGAVSLGALATNGMAFRNIAAARIADATNAELSQFNRSPCLKLGGAIPAAGECMLGGATQASVILWGDSHAAQLATALDALGKERGIGIRQITKAGCPPFPGGDYLPRHPLRRDCRAFNDAALRAILADPAIRTVLIAARWDKIVNGEILVSNQASTTTDASLRFASAAVGRTVAALRARGIAVAILNEIPSPSSDPFVCQRTVQFNRWNSAACDTFDARPALTMQRRVAAQILNGLPAGDPGVRVVDAQGTFCEGAVCRSRTAAGAIFMDETHLTRAGAALLAQPLRDMLMAGAAK